MFFVCGSALAQTARKPAAPSLPTQPTVEQAFEAADAQAKTDRTKILEQIRKDQTDPSTEALCRISVNQFLLESIDDYESHAAELKRVVERHRTQIESERAALTRALQEIPGFFAEVIPVESQQKLERQGLAKFNWTSNGQIRVSLEQVVSFFNLVSSRIQYCSKNPQTRREKLEQVTASLEDPYSNPTGLTYSQMLAAIRSLSTSLNASLKMQNSEFELRFADPVQDQSCSAGLELVQNIKTADNQSLRVVLKLAPSKTPGVVQAVHAPQGSQPYPSDIVFRSINESELPDAEIDFDGYVRASRKLQASSSSASDCLDSLHQNSFPEGYLDAPYLSPQQLAQAPTSIRSIESGSGSGSSAQPNFDFGYEHGLYLDSKKSLWTWGAESTFDNQDHSDPVNLVLPSALSVTQFVAGSNHTLLLLSDGSVRYFGLTATTGPVDVAISRESPVSRILANDIHNLVIHKNGVIEGFIVGSAPFGVYLPNHELPRQMAISNGKMIILTQRGHLYSIAVASPSQMAVAVPGSENLIFEQIDSSASTLFAVTKSGELYGMGTFNLPSAPAPSLNGLVRIPFERGRIRSVRISDTFGYLQLKDGRLLSIGAGLINNTMFSGSLTNPAEVTTPLKKIDKFWFGGGTLWVQSGKELWGIGEEPKASSAIALKPFRLSSSARTFHGNRGSSTPAVFRDDARGGFQPR